jgi:hypothetical protein
VASVRNERGIGPLIKLTALFAVVVLVVVGLYVFIAWQPAKPGSVTVTEIIYDTCGVSGNFTITPNGTYGNWVPSLYDQPTSSQMLIQLPAGGCLANDLVTQITPGWAGLSVGNRFCPLDNPCVVAVTVETPSASYTGPLNITVARG